MFQQQMILLRKETTDVQRASFVKNYFPERNSWQ